MIDIKFLENALFLWYDANGYFPKNLEGLFWYMAILYPNSIKTIVLWNYCLTNDCLTNDCLVRLPDGKYILHKVDSIITTYSLFIFDKVGF